MTQTTDTQDPADAVPEGPQGRPPEFTPEPGGTRIDVPLGRRVMVVSDLLLTPDATPSTLAVTGELAQALDTWDGPGVLVIAGNLFDLAGAGDPLGAAARSLDAHPALGRSLIRFLVGDERRVLRQCGSHEPGGDTPRPRTAPDTASHVVAPLAAAGVEHVGPVDLHVQTGTGVRVVRVDPGSCTPDTGRTPSAPPRTRLPTPSRGPWRRRRPAGTGGR